MTRLSLTLVALLFLAVPAGVRAELFCEQALFEAGPVRSGAPLAHRFTFRNKGFGPVEIVDVKPGCGCLRPRFERRTYRAGETAEVELEVNTLAQPGGPNTWRTIVRYREDGTDHELPLFVTAIVVSEVYVRPAALIIHTDTAIRHEVTLIERRAKPLGIATLLTTSRHIQAVKGEPRRTADGTWERSLALEVMADCPEGHHEEVLHIHTTDPVYSELKVPFTVVKKARQGVNAVPGVVNLTAGDGPLPARIVLLGAADGSEVLVERIEADSPALQCRWAPGPGARATLRIEVDRVRLSGPTWEGAVRVHLRVPAGQTVTVPVRCLLR